MYFNFTRGSNFTLFPPQSDSVNETGSYFGYSVALRSTLAVVGAPYAQANGRPIAGAAYTYFLTSSFTWTCQQILQNGLTNSIFGGSVSLTNVNGVNWLAVGASGVTVGKWCDSR